MTALSITHSDLATLPILDALPLSDPEDTRPTLEDVARVAGVSLATASRVLNGSHRVRPENRSQVENAMAALGYVRQRAARSGSVQRTGSIACVVCEETMRLFSDPFFARMLSGATRELTPLGIQLVLVMIQTAEDYRSAVERYLRGGHVDGALFVSMHGRHPIDLDRVGIPVAVAGRPVYGDATQLSYVDADNRGGAERATRHLITSGRGTIATVAGPPDMTPGVDRLDGFRSVLAGAGRPDAGLIVYGDFGQAAAEHATYRLLDRKPDVDGIFAASDLMALGVLRALRRSGRRVPDDVAVIGFDDSPIARCTEPPLTTIRQPIEEIGALLARDLLAQIDSGAEPRRVVLDTELVLRRSA